jgi:lipid-A-disaccharide synthase-like uncharacterized protein
LGISVTQLRELLRVTYRYFVKRLVAKGVVNLVLPVAFYSCENILVWYVLYLGGTVTLDVVFEDDTLDLVLCSAKPAFFEILKNDLEASLWAGNVAGVGDGYAEGSCTI